MVTKWTTKGLEEFAFPMTRKELSCELMNWCARHIAVRDGIPVNAVKKSAIAGFFNLAPSTISMILNADANNRAFTLKHFQTAAEKMGVPVRTLVQQIRDRFFEARSNPAGTYSQLLAQYLLRANDTGDHEESLSLAAESLGVSPSHFNCVASGEKGAYFTPEAFDHYCQQSGIELPDLLGKLQVMDKLEDSHRQLTPEPAMPGLERSVFKLINDWGREVSLPSNSKSGRGREINHAYWWATTASRRLLRSHTIACIKQLPVRPLSVLVLYEFGKMHTLVRVSPSDLAKTRFDGRGYTRVSEFSLENAPAMLQRSINKAWHENSRCKLVDGKLFEEWTPNTGSDIEDLRVLLGSQPLPGKCVATVHRVFADKLPFAHSEGHVRISLVVVNDVDHQPSAIESLMWSTVASTLGSIWAYGSNFTIHTNYSPINDHSVEYVDKIPHDALYEVHPEASKEITDRVNNIYQGLSSEGTNSPLGHVAKYLYGAELWVFDFTCRSFLQLDDSWSQAFESKPAKDVIVNPATNENLLDGYKRFLSEKWVPREYGKTYVATRERRTVIVSDPGERGICVTPGAEYLDVGTYLQIPITINDEHLGRRLFGALALRFSHVLKEGWCIPEKVRDFVYRSSICKKSDLGQDSSSSMINFGDKKHQAGT